MKRNLLLLFVMLLAVHVNATTINYVDSLQVTVNGVTNPKQQATIVVTNDANGYTLSLLNFIFYSGTSAMPVGNITLTDIHEVENNTGYIQLEATQNVRITAGDLEGVSMWTGPMLGEVPIKLAWGYIAGSKLYCDLYIDLSATMGQIVGVTFGDKYLTDTYVDQLAIAVNGNDLQPQQAAIYLTEDITSGAHNLTLPNFVMVAGTEMMPIGTISVDVKTDVTEEATTFSANKTVNIKAGDLESIPEAYWMGPSLGDVPLSLTGAITTEGFYVVINIDLTLTMQQTVVVTFGTNSNITNINNDAKPSNVYSLQGLLLRKGVSYKDALTGLPKGIYIVNGEKRLVK